MSLAASGVPQRSKKGGWGRSIIDPRKRRQGSPFCTSACPSIPGRSRVVWLGGVASPPLLAPHKNCLGNDLPESLECIRGILPQSEARQAVGTMAVWLGQTGHLATVGGSLSLHTWEQAYAQHALTQTAPSLGFISASHPFCPLETNTFIEQVSVNLQVVLSRYAPPKQEMSCHWKLFLRNITVVSKISNILLTKCFLTW